MKFDELPSGTRVFVDDSIVIATMRLHQIKHLATFDRDFDHVAGIEICGPA